MILRGKDFWVRQIFMERHSEGEFLWDEAIWSRVLLQAHYYSTFWFSHNDVRQCLFFLIGFIQQLHWLIIVLNIFFRFEVEFFSTPKKKKQSSTTKKSYRVLSRCACAKLRKISEVDSWAFTATKICTPGCYTGKILSVVKNSRHLSKINWNLFLALNLNFLKLFSVCQSQMDKQIKGHGVK